MNKKYNVHIPIKNRINRKNIKKFGKYKQNILDQIYENKLMLAVILFSNGIEIAECKYAFSNRI